MTRVDRALILVFTAFLATLTEPLSADAQSAEAEVLFREGRRLIKAGKLEAGCDKLEASERLESSVGTLLNLGDCREKLGRYASAWGAFRKAEALAKVRGEPRRRNEASKRALAIEPKLTHLVIISTSHAPGLVVKRDGEAIDPAMLSSPLPVDPDTYTIVAEAPGYKPWRRDVIVNGKQRRHVVTIPALEKDPSQPKAPEKLAPTELPIAPTPSPVVTTPVVVEKSRGERSMWTTTRKVSLGFAAGGALAAGVGVYFGVRSSDLESRSNEICPGTVCDDPDGLSLNDRAQDAARNANILYAVGGAAIATSIVLWFVGAPSGETVVSPNVGRDYAGASFGGRF